MKICKIRHANLPNESLEEGSERENTQNEAFMSLDFEPLMSVSFFLCVIHKTFVYLLYKDNIICILYS